MTDKHPSQTKGSREEPVLVLPALPPVGAEVLYRCLHVGDYRAVVLNVCELTHRVDIDVDPRVPSPGGDIPEPLKLRAIRLALTPDERGCVVLK